MSFYSSPPLSSPFPPLVKGFAVFSLATARGLRQGINTCAHTSGSQHLHSRRRWRSQNEKKRRGREAGNGGGGGEEGQTVLNFAGIWMGNAAIGTSSGTLRNSCLAPFPVLTAVCWLFPFILAPSWNQVGIKRRKQDFYFLILWKQNPVIQRGSAEHARTLARGRYSFLIMLIINTWARSTPTHPPSPPLPKSHPLPSKLAGDNYRGLMRLQGQSQASQVNLRKRQSLFLFVSVSLSICQSLFLTSTSSCPPPSPPPPPPPASTQIVLHLACLEITGFPLLLHGGIILLFLSINTFLLSF